MNITVEKYMEDKCDKWEKFVLERSYNGTCLNTRNFISYHKNNKFIDHSLMFYKGSELIAIILACQIEEAGEKVFFSHMGTSYGGFVVADKFYNVKDVKDLFDVFEMYLKRERFTKVYIKQVPDIISSRQQDLIEYMYYYNGYSNYKELGSYIDLDSIEGNDYGYLTAKKRRDFNYSLKNDLLFEEFSDRKEIATFHNILAKNLKKFDKTPIHTVQDLIELKELRIPIEMTFYSIKKDDRMIAASMVFLFQVQNKRIFHTQYLSSLSEGQQFYSMDNLIVNLIETARREKYNIFSFGISTEEQGKYLNEGLINFKAGFGTDYCIFPTYEKEILKSI